jgi:hypothetical protein
MVLVVEPLHMPALEGGLQREGKEILVHPGLNADSANHLAIGSTQLIFQKEVIFEKGKIRKVGETSLAEVDKDDDLENGDGIQMGEFNFEVVKESMEEITSWETQILVGRSPWIPLF